MEICPQISQWQYCAGQAQGKNALNILFAAVAINKLNSKQKRRHVSGDNMRRAACENVNNNFVFRFVVFSHEARYA